MTSPRPSSGPVPSGAGSVPPGGPVVRDAATVMLVRDTAEGMEVFMLRRNLKSDFVGGAYVFPGGAVDPDDRHANLEKICAGRDDAAASDLLSVPSGGLAYWVAAVRECFEEAGVLLAYDSAGEVLSLGDPATAERFAEHRRAVDTGERRLIEICEEEGLALAADRIHYFSHWITPVGAPRRYDTRFFVTAAPPEQEPLHDNREAIAKLWVRPSEALRRHRAGELDMILPTIKNLEAIGRFERSEELLTAAAAIESVPTILPRVAADGSGVRILLPGDAGYDELAEDGRLPDGWPMPGRPGGPASG
ncbi:MAG TPA: NUDIX domain-containing protein [Acidimicrobiales bacterium]|nr:NUDIX domain-containing protein [Acidimicrobiales bacterium]